MSECAYEIFSQLVEELHEMDEIKYEHLFVDGTKIDETFRGRNSFSKAEPDATFGHLKEDHMRNAQLKPGFNVQFGVEGEYITGVLVSPERSGYLTLIPLLEQLRSHGVDYADVTADAGYESTDYW